jgi:hypothetical protein
VLDRVNAAKLPEVLKNRLNLRKAGRLGESCLAARDGGRNSASTGARKPPVRALSELGGDQQERTGRRRRGGLQRRGGPRRCFALGRRNRRAGRSDQGDGRARHPHPPGQPGETCVNLVDAKHDLKNPLFTRCTYGIGVAGVGRRAMRRARP